jgi:hypothetical protein
MPFVSIPQAIDEIRSGRILVVVDEVANLSGVADKAPAAEPDTQPGSGHLCPAYRQRTGAVAEAATPGELSGFHWQVADR